MPRCLGITASIHDVFLCRFPRRNRETGEQEEVSIEDHFLQRHGIRLNMPLLPVVEVKPGRREFVPAELLE